MRKVKFGHKGWLAINALNMSVYTILNGISIYLLRYITDFGLNRELDKMLDIAQLMAILLVVGLFVSSIGTLLKSEYIERSLMLMKKKYIAALLQQDITQLQKEKTNVYRSNLTNDFDNYERKFILNTLAMMEMMLQFLMAVVLVATISWTLVLVAFSLLLVFLFMTNNISKPVQKTEAKKSVSLSEYTEYVEETLQGFEIIKQHQLEQSRYDKFVAMSQKVQKDNYAVDVKTTHVEAINRFVQTAVLFSIVVIGILYAKSESVGLGSLIVVASSFGNVMWPLQQFAPILTEMKGILNVLESFDKNLTRPVLNRNVSIDAFETLHFRECDLGYQEDDFSILHDVTLTINKNEKILIIGPSGAGKSTVLKTIRQSITPKKGSVLCNNQNIYQLIPIDYYSLFTTVDQLGFIFNGSVYDNVTLYQAIPKEKVAQSLIKVGLQSLDVNQQLFNNGANLSGGQRARLMLARALVLDSDVILCDEIFASLDLSIASSIEKDMLTLPKTMINVSHIVFKEHLSAYDKIYIVDQNSLTLTSNHQDVLSKMSLSNTQDISIINA